MLVSGIMLVLALLVGGSPLAAITCVGNDVSEICDLPIAEGNRCNSQIFSEVYCGDNADCGDNCFGVTPSGHWFDMSRLDADGVPQPRWRCRCGCLAEETVFEGLTDVTGSEIVAKKAGMVASLDTIDSQATSYRAINGITYGAEQELAIKITTVGGRTMILSRAHPVVIVNEQGKIVAVKQAETLQRGELLLATDGQSDRIVQLQEQPYTGKMVNFNVQSDSAVNHLLFANELLVGDLAWQERLTSVQSRILYRQEILQALGIDND